MNSVKFRNSNSQKYTEDINYYFNNNNRLWPKSLYTYTEFLSYQLKDWVKHIQLKFKVS